MIPNSIILMEFRPVFRNGIKYADFTRIRFYAALIDMITHCNYRIYNSNGGRLRALSPPLNVTL